jgi:hypothetical protein
VRLGLGVGLEKGGVCFGLTGSSPSYQTIRALESSLSPIVIFATNRGVCTIRGV